MTKHYLLALAKEYHDTVLHFVDAKLHPLGTQSGMQAQVLAHVKAVLAELPKKVEDGKDAEALSDLGFVQGAFWVLRTFTLEDIANHNSGYEHDHSDHEGHDHSHAGAQTTV